MTPSTDNINFYFPPRAPSKHTYGDGYYTITSSALIVSRFVVCCFFSYDIMSQSRASSSVACQTTIWPFNFIIKFHLSSELEKKWRRTRVYMYSLIQFAYAYHHLPPTISTSDPFPVLFVFAVEDGGLPQG